jgi:FlaA1/EpsC-like NDP-sugar epimerase
MNFRNRFITKSSNLILLGDQVLILAGLVTSFLISPGMQGLTIYPKQLLLACAATTIFWGITLSAGLGLNKRMVRFLQGADYLHAVKTISIVYICAFVTVLLFFKHYGVYLTKLYSTGYFAACVYVIISRLVINEVYSKIKTGLPVTGKRKLLIYNAGELGIMLKKAITIGKDCDVEVVGFLDTDPNKIDRYIEGIKVFDATKGIANLVAACNITDVMIAAQRQEFGPEISFLSALDKCNVKVREISSAQQLLDPHLNINNFSVTNISKLVNRKPIELYNEYVEITLRGKKVLVTGAAGSIGSEIVRKLCEHGAALIICVDFAESALYDIQQEVIRDYPDVKFEFMLADVRDEDIMYNILNNFKPHFLYHAASYKHVPLMEQFPWQAIQTNVISTWKLVKMAVQFKVEKFVFISTDKAVKPTSIMGASKRLAEIIVQSYSSIGSSTCFAITRFGNVLGSNGSVVPLFKKQIEKGGPVTVTHPEMTRYFMTIAEACQLVLEASVMAEGGEVFLFDMGKPVKIADLAKNMIRMAGLVPDVDINIKFIGQRPGEKLHEELFLDDEKMQETYHEKIMISKERRHDIAEVEKIIYNLQALEDFYDPEVFQRVINEILPEYQPLKTKAVHAVAV